METSELIKSLHSDRETLETENKIGNQQRLILQEQLDMTNLQLACNRGRIQQINFVLDQIEEQPPASQGSK